MSLADQQYLEGLEDTQEGKFLTFSVQNEGYGIEIRHVTEIIGMQRITEVPELPAFLRGVINLRGKIIPLMDVRVRFKRPVIAYTDRTCIVVVDIGDLQLGLIVDTVTEVLDIRGENVLEPPETMIGPANRYIKGIGKTADGVTLLLDCEKLLHPEEVTYCTRLHREETV